MLDLDRLFSGEGPPQVIAEVGSNHDRSWEQALRLIEVAATTGAAAVKFQTYSADTLYSKTTKPAAYLVEQGLVKPGETIADLIRRVELPREWQPRLDAACREHGVTFLSTPFDMEAVDQLAALGVPAFKVASTEITHMPLIEAIGATRRPVILSTGMASFADIERALGWIGHDRVVLLQCTTAYPSLPEDANLRVLSTYRDRFGLPVGYSDHTRSSTAAAVAVALGARLFEKHYTTDRSREGPDHPFALEPDELTSYVRSVNEAFAALGSAEKRPLSVEAEYRRYRPGLFAATDLAAGTTLEREHVVVKRKNGADGIEAFDLRRVLGRRLTTSLASDDQLEWAHVG